MGDVTIKVGKRTPGACAEYTWTKPDEVLDVDVETATVLFTIKDADFYDPTSGEAKADEGTEGDPAETAKPKTTRAKAKADEGTEVTED